MNGAIGAGDLASTFVFTPPTQLEGNDTTTLLQQDVPSGPTDPTPISSEDDQSGLMFC